VSKGNSLKEPYKEGKDEEPDGTVYAVHDKENEADTAQGQEDEGVHKVANQQALPPAACTYNTTRNEEYVEEGEEKSKDGHIEDYKYELQKTQHINPSGMLCVSLFQFERSIKDYVLVHRNRKIGNCIC